MPKTKIQLSGKELIDLLLEEYRSLREEVLRAISARFQILSFGIAGVALLATCSVKGISDGDHKFAPAILYLLVPVICLFTFYTWYSEMRRARRASWYLWGIERRFNSQCDVRVFSWEHDLREGMKIAGVYRKHYYVTAGLFATVASVCFYLGFTGTGIKPMTCFWLSLILAAVFILIMFYECHELYKFDSPGQEWPKEIENKNLSV